MAKPTRSAYRAHQAFETGEQTSQQAGRIAELEQMVGRLTMQLEIAKKALGGLSGDRGGSWVEGMVVERPDQLWVGDITYTFATMLPKSREIVN